MLYMFHTYVVSILFRCCVYLQWFSSVSQVFFISVLDTCFKCFICLRLYDRVLHLSPRLLLPCILLKLGKRLGGMVARMRGHAFPFHYG
jgi:hypothetical protein